MYYYLYRNVRQIVPENEYFNLYEKIKEKVIREIWGFNGEEPFDVQLSRIPDGDKIFLALEKYGVMCTPTDDEVVSFITNNVFIRGVELDCYERSFCGQVSDPIAEITQDKVPRRHTVKFHAQVGIYEVFTAEEWLDGMNCCIEEKWYGNNPKVSWAKRQPMSMNDRLFLLNTDDDPVTTEKKDSTHVIVFK